MFFWIVIFPVLLFLGLIALMTMGMFAGHNDKNRRIAASRLKAERLKSEGYKYVLVDPTGKALALRPEHSEIYIDDLNGTFTFPYRLIRTVSLVPVSETHSETTGESRTSRGSQIISATIGGAFAGPAGALAGGLSGKQTSQSSTTFTTTIIDYELEVHFLDDEMPRVSLNAGAQGSFGLSVPHGMDDQFKQMAARLANAVHNNTAAHTGISAK